ncbi:hypothetical protein KI688_004883 [Linnemannia hyalina]|uniref:F-box domain-containing protein n=1 Tax=Linnemannia hyalina TaxID=64524 RepID=A0A9P7XN57_9FUNG|nr:hypothetical protein KI688_004883 [Linnemannia hyalina]
MNQESITTDTTSFGDLPPEVHEMVASHLNSNDLRLSVLVSKSWRAIFHRYLWRYVEIMLDLGSDIDHKRVNLLKANCNS